MTRLILKMALAAGSLMLAAAPALAGVPADAVNGDMSLGSPKARIQVLEYASAACPHCAHVNAEVIPAFKKTYIDTGRVRFTLKEFLTDPAEVAAGGFLLARCGGKAKYFAILDDVFRSQVKWRAGNIGQVFTEVGTANGLTPEQVNSCLTDPAALAALNTRVETSATQDKIESTPTFVVNGKRVAGYSLEDLAAAIAAASKRVPAAVKHRPKVKRP